MSNLQRIMKFVPPPRNPVSPGRLEDFASVEGQLGFVLPAEYKLLVNIYGDGQWQEFWYHLNPFSRKENINLLRQCSRVIGLAPIYFQLSVSFAKSAHIHTTFGRKPTGSFRGRSPTTAVASFG